MASTLQRLVRLVRDLTAPASGRGGSGSTPARTTPNSTTPDAGAPHRAYPGDADRLPDTTYAPKPDGRPDPGEIVWTWVPYEEDHRQGKDRPVLVVGRDGAWLVALALTSKDHDRDEAQERRAGREWVDIGSGPWDRRGRASEVRVNRLIRVDPAAVRREGAVLPRDRYDAVVAGARAALG
ncbi:PemK-like, MazF-like toxin of type II toxin-antitoxin system [Terracoccus luteus]|uniref:PemK-like, MazF-like toxin of type II toxin-antitoxin system n=1 Tax=Terracoccus luteus TaxID=53356 RepID=A0A495XT12_9MICO|nr:type II toxin-antitoxin system PemK/MazF family toxin [Terracoccus luteus]RKT77650.1 PemK-like, MazF-like toxin of type II toxin-antitoxin system [Terracoccus luteus]